MSQSRRKQQVKEYLYIGALTLAILVVTPTILRLLTEAWNTQGFVYNLIWGVGYTIGNPDIVFILPVTIYIGLLAVFSLDRMKKIQGIILSLSSIYATYYLYQNSILIQNVNWLGNLPVIIIGLVIGAYLGGGKKLLDDSWPHEFRRAPVLIFYILLVVIGAGLLEKHLIYETPLLATAEGLSYNSPELTTVGLDTVGLFPNLIFGLFLLVVVDQFTAYELQRSFMVLGPKRGGKTTLMTGAFHTADQVTLGNASASDKLIQYRQKLVSSSAGFGTVDEPTAVDETHELYFDYDYGQYLKKNVVVSAIDHGGEVLPRLKSQIDKLNSETWLSSVIQYRSQIGQLIFDDEKKETTRTHTAAVQEVAKSVVEADSLIITVPLDDFIEGNVQSHNIPEYYTPKDEKKGGTSKPDKKEYLAEYDMILDWFTNEKQSRVIIVATMADLVLNEFREQKLNGNRLTTEDHYRRFEYWIKTEILGSELNRLQRYSDDEIPLSVHFKMNPNENHVKDGKIKPNPKLPDGSVEFVGGKRLLRKLGE